MNAKPSRFRFRVWPAAAHESVRNMYILATCTPEGLSKSSDYAVMQSTGLADKNGKEIFEGDVVARLNANQKITSALPVSWHAKSASFMRGGARLHKVHGKYGMIVLGNIYEQPELLGKKEE